MGHDDVKWKLVVDGEEFEVTESEPLNPLWQVWSPDGVRFFEGPPPDAGGESAD